MRATVKRKEREIRENKKKNVGKSMVKRKVLSASHFKKKQKITFHERNKTGFDFNL
jgi:hypothetical protein